MKLARRIRLPILILLALAACSREVPQSWLKPVRIVNIPADVRKALVIAHSSSVLSGYGPLAGVLNELLSRDLNDLAPGLNDVDWSQETCIWTFDTTISEVAASGATVTIKPTHEEGSGIRFWFFPKASLGKIKKIQFE
jgi:hypothetical protein